MDRYGHNVIEEVSTDERLGDVRRYWSTIEGLVGGYLRSVGLTDEGRIVEVTEVIVDRLEAEGGCVMMPGAVYERAIEHLRGMLDRWADEAAAVVDGGRFEHVFSRGLTIKALGPALRYEPALLFADLSWARQRVRLAVVEAGRAAPAQHFQEMTRQTIGPPPRWCRSALWRFWARRLRRGGLWLYQFLVCW